MSQPVEKICHHCFWYAQLMNCSGCCFLSVKDNIVESDDTCEQWSPIDLSWEQAIRMAKLEDYKPD